MAVWNFSTYLQDSGTWALRNHMAQMFDHEQASIRAPMDEVLEEHIPAYAAPGAIQTAH